MKSIKKLTASSTVDEVLLGWPHCISVFKNYGLKCLECPVSSMETLADVAKTYGLDLRKFLAQLSAVSGKAKMAKKPKSKQ